ncbi:hypothetical protein Cgig2_006125 [Carnegiea gigantea]|uniref:Uncharacterized protein n=1 Tax=Carnegiea gigantea TaxID=171969 RepID=A0A9Q1L0B4_9CARY|nr:hypothetical protein Cgig2_006125 [Carnegiea gigantea]
MGLFDLEKHFAFYGAYHSNPVNIFIHVVFVWPIFFSGLMLFHFIPMVFFPDFGLFFTLIYALFYVGMDKKAGFLAAVLCFLCYFGATALATRLGFSLACKEATVQIGLMGEMKVVHQRVKKTIPSPSILTLSSTFVLCSANPSLAFRWQSPPPPGGYRNR